jgi:hypothetical protein
MIEDAAKPPSQSNECNMDATPKRPVHDQQIFGYIRNISSVCQYLEERINYALQQSAALVAAPRKISISGVLNASLLGRIDKKIKAQFAAIEKLFTLDAGELDWGSCEITSIELLWDQLRESLDSALASDDSAEQHFKPILNNLDSIVFQCQSLTLSPRVNDILCNLRVGQPLDMDFAFSDAFPKDPKLCQRLIDELAQQSYVLNGGVVDTEQHIVYRTALTRRGQWMSIWRLLVFILLGLLLPFVLAFAGRVLPSWQFFQPSDFNLLLDNYVVILLGSGAHFAIAALKAAKAQSRPSFQALYDWVLWVHIRETKIFTGIAYIWTGYLLLSFGIHGLSWSSAFFAGYSIDSVTELFLGRFEATAAAETKLLTKT